MAHRKIVLHTPQLDTPATATTEHGTAVDPAGLLERFAAIRRELEVPGEFPPEALAEAEEVAAHPLDLPDRDETAVPFVTIDPSGSMDLDQALHLERDGDGYRVRYAIADVPCFVAAGGAIDQEARRRGQTIYLPDGRAPLHPPTLSEGAASLLPGERRPAFVWDMRLDADGEGTSVEVYRAMVASTARLDYEGVQRYVEAGNAPEVLVLLKEVGEKRIVLEAERGGANLPMPEQEVTEDADGRFRLAFRPPVRSEDWNAQISLMTGMAAAEMMVHGQIGILRTMPAPDQDTQTRFRRAARALGIEWPAEQLYGDFLRSLDRANPRHLALIHQATMLFRGAAYTPFDGDVPEQAEHAAVASVYAHVTAPLRRLVDRFGLVICESLTADQEVPTWVREALPRLPEIMAASDRKANAVERACADAVEAAVLSSRVGELLPATVVGTGREKGTVTVMVEDPAVVANARGEAELGSQVQVAVDGADVSAGTVELSVQQG